MDNFDIDRLITLALNTTQYTLKSRPDRSELDTVKLAAESAQAEFDTMSVERDVTQFASTCTTL